jgi:hypothetical protein
MSDANKWQASPNPVPAFTSIASFAEQYFVAIDGQTVFNLTLFTYSPGSKALHVHINGVKQRRGIDFIETSTTSFTLDEALEVGDTVMAEAFNISVAV